MKIIMMMVMMMIVMMMIVMIMMTVMMNNSSPTLTVIQYSSVGDKRVVLNHWLPFDRWLDRRKDG